MVHGIAPVARPSAPAFWAAVATQRRAISVVGEQNGKDCDHADRAPAASWRAGRDAPGRRRRGLPGMTLCGRSCVAEWVSGAQCQTRHAPVSGGLARAWSAAADAGAAPDAAAVPAAVPAAAPDAAPDAEAGEMGYSTRP